MDLRSRPLARAGASALGLLAAAALATPATATPATATPATAGGGNAVDLSIAASAGTIAADASGKFAKINLTNASRRGEARNLLLILDVRGLDQSKVRLDVGAATGENGPVCGQPENGLIRCRTADGVLPAGIQVGWFFPMKRVADATGRAGRIRAAVTHDGADPAAGNNTATLDVRVGTGGPDMFAVADDGERVFHLGEDGSLNWGGPVRPGEVTTALYMIVNQGGTATTGMRVTITLPRGTSFADAGGPQPAGCGAGADGCTFDHCAYRRDNRSVSCLYRHFPLIPADEDASQDDQLISKQGFFHRIRVDGDVAPGPLVGGSVRVSPLVGGSSREADVSDSTDGFAVIVS